MKYRRGPTRNQAIMVALLAVAVGWLIAFGLFEISGVIDAAAEDTFSEWVWDLPFGWVLGIAALFGIVGVLAVWAAGHFIEGWSRRRRRETAAAERGRKERDAARDERDRE